MVATVKDVNITTRTARARLRVSRNLYWRTIVAGRLHIGYRREKVAGNGVWYSRLYDGKKYSVRRIGIADDLVEADGVSVLSFEEAQERAKLTTETVRKAKTTVADAIARYVAAARTRGAKTADEMAKKAARLILPELGDIPIAKLTTKKLNDWRDGLANSAASYRGGSERPSSDRARRVTANKARTILIAALNHVFEEDEDEGLSDAAWKKFKPFREGDAPKSRHLSAEEVGRILNAADAESGFRDLLRAGIETGARYGELTRLRVRDFANGKIAIEVSKTGKPRSIDITEDGVAFFTSISAGRSPDDLLLPNRRLGREWRKSEQNRPMLAACKAARIDPPINFYGATRHTYASLAVMNGMPLISVAHVLGHASTRMTERHYAHLSPSHVADQVARFAPRLGAVEPSNVEPLTKRNKTVANARAAG